ncbi:MAG: hypothetical protein ACJAT2_002574 [Bacteriovoracaceae bacterium]
MRAPALFLFFIYLSISTLLASGYPSNLVIDQSTELREVSYFEGSSHILGFLNPGDSADILSIDTSHEGGVSFQVRVSSGAQGGKIGWIFFAEDPDKRNFNIKDPSGKKISTPGAKGKAGAGNSKGSEQEASIQAPEGKDIDMSKTGIETFSSAGSSKKADSSFKESPFKNYFQEMKKEMRQVSKGKASYPAVPERLTKIKPEKEIWDEAIKGDMKIDLESYDGGPYIPFTKTVTDTSGYKQKTTYWTKSEPKQIMKMPSKISAALEEKQRECKDEAESTPEAVVPKVVKGNWQPHCKVLAAEKFGDFLYNEISSCLESIKEVITKGAKNSDGSLNREKVFKNLYKKLNRKEQEFAALTLTAFGEAGILAPPLEEMVMVMKVVSNRADYARSKGFAEANELDSALQKAQFSMYNKNDPSWQRAIKSGHGHPHTINSIKSYILYHNTKIENPREVGKVYHYHTNYVSPDWKDTSKIVKPVLNGKNLKQRGTRHHFFKNIPWSFRHNSWSGKK